MLQLSRIDWGRWRAGLLAAGALGLAAYINHLFWFYTEYRLAITLDTSGYLSQNLVRAQAYPALAFVVNWLSGDLRWMTLLQLNALLAGFIYLAYGFGRVTGSRVAGAALLLLLAGILPLLKVSQHILTEALFAALICAHLGALCLYLRRASLLSAAVIGGTVALIYGIRPAGLPFAATIVLLAFITPTSNRSPLEGEQAKQGRSPKLSGGGMRVRALTAAGAALIAGLLLVAAANKATRPDTFGLPSAGGIFLLSHVAHLLQDGAGTGAGSRHEQLLSEIAQENAWRGIPPATDWPEDYARASMNAGAYMYALLRKLNEGGAYPRDVEQLAQTNRRAMALALIIIREHPLQYMKLASAHYYHLWRHGFLQNTAVPGGRDIMRGIDDLPVAARNSYLHSRKRLDSDIRSWYNRKFTRVDYYFDPAVEARYAARAGGATLPCRWWARLTGNRGAIISAALLLTPVALLLLLLSPQRRRDPVAQLAAYAAFLLQANTLFITAVHTGIARYTVPLTPLLFMFLLAMCVLAARLARVPSGTALSPCRFMGRLARLRGLLGQNEVHE